MQNQSLIASGKYVYAPLRSPSNTRTLTIEPGTYGSNIRCSLREVHPGDGKIYTALSYVWGSPDFPRMIYGNDSDNNSGILRVTENLHAALQIYRPVDQPITMWIDAICINQDDLE